MRDKKERDLESEIFLRNSNVHLLEENTQISLFHSVMLGKIFRRCKQGKNSKTDARTVQFFYWYTLQVFSGVVCSHVLENFGELFL